MGRNCGQRRGAAIYVVVLGTAMLVAVLGLSSLLVKRVQRRMDQGATDAAEARLYAQAAVEMGLFRIQHDEGWRNTYVSGVWEADKAIADGTYTLEGIDPNDNNLKNAETDPVVLIGTGVCGKAIQKTQVKLVAVEPPLEVLGTCVHAALELQIKGGKTLTVTGAPASGNANFRNDGVLYGSVEAATRSGGGTVTGTETIPAPPKDLPDAGVFDLYVAKATQLPYSGDLDGHVLAPGHNDYGGGLNEDGLYYINTGGKDLLIRGTRIHGALIVQTGGKEVVCDIAVLLHNYRADYPVLIVDGNLELRYKTAESALDESQWVNFNPDGAPYGGSTDEDDSDVYPNEIRGLVHATGDVLLKETARVRGMVICEGKVTCEDSNEIIHDLTLYENPPEGYRQPLRMEVSPGTWRQIVIE